MRPVSGGTDTHLALIDLRGVGVTGTEAEQRCDAARITLNKNAIPYDPQPPMVASGIRVGTPSVTTQGMGPEQMTEVASLIGRAVTRHRRQRGRRDRRCGLGPHREVPRLPARLTAAATRRARVPAHPVRRGGGHLPDALASVRVFAIRYGFMAEVRDRDVHDVPDPAARRRRDAPRLRWPRCSSRASLPLLSSVFDTGYEHVGRPGRPAPSSSARSGVVDDRWGLDALTKLAGQALAGAVMAAAGRAAALRPVARAQHGRARPAERNAAHGARRAW